MFWKNTQIRIEIKKWLSENFTQQNRIKDEIVNHNRNILLDSVKYWWNNNGRYTIPTFSNDCVLYSLSDPNWVLMHEKNSIWTQIYCIGIINHNSNIDVFYYDYYFNGKLKYKHDTLISVVIEGVEPKKKI